MTKRGILFSILLAIAAIVVLMPAGILTWEYTNSDHFCSNACHSVHPEEPMSHQLLSPHPNVTCTECHIGRMGFFNSLVDKAGHVTHAWSLFAGFERPTESKSLLTAEKSCQQCHSDRSHGENSIKAIPRIAEDKKNSRENTLLIMRLNKRHFGREERLGIDWHASGAIRYWSDDPKKLAIKQVEATFPDGTVQTYRDVTDGGAAAGTKSEGRQFDCLGCHNREGHPFPGPHEILDELFGNDTLPRQLPLLKKRLMELYNRQIETTEGIRLAVRETLEQIQQEVTESGSAKKQAAAENLDQLEDLIVGWLDSARNLRSQNMNWTHFPDYYGHTDHPGCFRCHNGRMQTEEAVPISVNCTDCHSIPLVTKGRTLPSYYREQLDLRKPRDHRDPAYLSKHMEQDTATCDRCHGAIDYGEDDQSHCSNSACHGRKWEHLDLEYLRSDDQETGGAPQG